MKKPQALFGLLAALGTAIGVLVAVFGLPYGRADYTAFAGLYHNGTPVGSTVHIVIDCDVVTPGTQDACVFANTVTSVPVDITVGNNTATDEIILAFNYAVVNDNAALLTPPVVANPGTCDDNPNFDEPAMQAIAVDITLVTWSYDCSPAPNPNQTPAPGTTRSFFSAFISPGSTGSEIPGDNSHHTLTRIQYTHPGGMNGVSNLAFEPSTTTLANPDAIVLISSDGTTACDLPVYCRPASITFAPPPPTNTPLPATATTVPPTNTPVPTATNTPLGASVNKIPESCIAPADLDNCDPLIPAANLWLCLGVGECNGAGEGNLYVYEYVSNVITGDTDGDTIPDGLGAYEFSVEYDNFVIQSLNPEDIVFNPGPVAPYPNGTDGVADGEGAARAPASCGFSLIFENVIHFGCVTSGQVEGPTGNMDLARLNLIPHPDLTNDIFPGNDNGVVTVLKDNGCEIVDIFGHPSVGSINGGLTPVCGDLAVTVRILEGDLNLDCEVDVQDQQLIAFRYGAFFGSLLYSQWYDLEPNLHDLDIDIKDIQKVFGRDGSTCQDPIQPQPPVGPPAPFGN